MTDLLDVTTTCLNAIRELPDGDRRRVVSALTAVLDLVVPAPRSPKDPKDAPEPVKEKPARKPIPKAPIQ